MPLYHSTICAAVLLFPLFCAEQILAQDVPPPNDQHFNPAQIGVAGESKYHRCFEQPHGAMDARHRLPASARYWLEEDAVYIITPEERCAFLHLNTDEERDQFAEQFWYRRSSDPDSPDNDFKVEHYRRIALANEKYAAQLTDGGSLAGWKTDRGRIYILFGAPDSIEVPPNGNKSATQPSQHSETSCRSEKWRYQHIQGITETAGMDFDFVACDGDYRLVLPQADQTQFLDAVTRNIFRNPKHSDAQYPGNIELYVGAAPSPKVMFKDLEAIDTTRMVRDQVNFTHKIAFAQATQATTLARIDIEIPWNTRTSDGRFVHSVEYQLFVRVSRPSGWVVDTSELTAHELVHDAPDATFSLDNHFDVPLPPGMYQLAVVVKDVSSGDVGAVRTTFDVPTYAALERTYDPVPLSPTTHGT